MMYLEMSRDEAHGGGTWAFPNCVWAPTEKEGGGKWPFWTKVLDAKVGDIILHLRGVQPHAFFVGYSQVSRDGFETSKQPPDPTTWSYSKNFYRADLEGFTPFHRPINLSEIFSVRRRALDEYFDKNKARGATKLNIFFVRQSGRLQCLNGAYLSDIDQELLDALFGTEKPANIVQESSFPVTVETGSQVATIRSRLGQSAFSQAIKDLYGNTCCFPSCSVADSRFLVASHIARWSDNENLRGHLGNGLCLCLMHDKAFELGLFTLDEKYRVFVNPKEVQSGSPLASVLLSHHGEKIKLSRILPLEDALLEHWMRVDISP